MECIRIGNCDAFRVSPVLDSLQFLEILEIRKCKNITNLTEFPVNLRSIDLSFCPALEVLPEIEHLQFLQSLTLVMCGLKKIPDWPQSLQNVVVRACHNLDPESNARIQQFK